MSRYQFAIGVVITYFVGGALLALAPASLTIPRGMFAAVLLVLRLIAIFAVPVILLDRLAGPHRRER